MRGYRNENFLFCYQICTIYDRVLPRARADMQQLRVAPSAFACCVCLQDNGEDKDPTLYSEYTGRPEQPAQGATRGYPGCPPRPRTEYVPEVKPWTYTSQTNYMVSPAELDVCCDHHMMLRDEFEAYKTGPLQCKHKGCSLPILYIPPVGLDPAKHDNDTVTVCSGSHTMLRHEYNTYIRGERKCPNPNCEQTLIAKPTAHKKWNRIVVMCSRGHMADDICYAAMLASGRTKCPICQETLTEEFTEFVPTCMPRTGPDAPPPLSASARGFEKMSLDFVIPSLQLLYERMRGPDDPEWFSDEVNGFREPLFQAAQLHGFQCQMSVSRALVELEKHWHNIEHIDSLWAICTVHCFDPICAHVLELLRGLEGWQNGDGESDKAKLLATTPRVVDSDKVLAFEKSIARVRRIHAVLQQFRTWMIGHYWRTKIYS